MGDVLVIDTDRSFTGQDGHMITPDSELYGVPGKLAERLFAFDPNIDYMFVLQNIVTVRRSGGWDEETAAEVADITHSFLRFYPDDEEVSSKGATESSSDEEE